jgi:hypothetical protein
MNILCVGALIEKWDVTKFREFWFGRLFNVHAPGKGCGSDYLAVATLFMQKIDSETDPCFLTSYNRNIKTIQQQSDEEACGDVSAQNHHRVVEVGTNYDDGGGNDDVVSQQRPGVDIDSDSAMDAQSSDDWPCFLDEDDLSHMGGVSRMHLEVERDLRVKIMEGDGCTDDDDDFDVA